MNTALPPAPAQRRKAFQASSGRTADLDSLSTAELRAEWQARFGQPAPHIRRQLLLAALAYEHQAERHGGLSKRCKKRLRRLAEGDDSSPPPLPAGTRLMREWQGQHHTVVVTEAGFEWNGQVFASLSAVARAITGTRWSGPRFFGLEQGSEK